ncbi:helix-turn-helix domain-containing protein [Streptomyces sp. WAC00263]|uniref:helix-turn-helix domain-containing protein n=1 Tax=Streptomyces sp. WAC00263 TaxID=1917422 RepID=UPI00322025E6
MRYPDEGGPTAEQRERCEEVCMRAADLFAEDVKVPCVTRKLRVSEKSVDQWRRAWAASGGREALRSQGPAPPAASGVRPGERSQEPSPVASSAGRRGEFRRPGGPAVCCCRRSWRWATAPARAFPSPGG